MKEKPTQIYKHKQIGLLIIGAIAPAIVLSMALLAVVVLDQDMDMVSLIIEGSVIPILVASLVLFYSLTVEVNNSEIIVFLAPDLFASGLMFKKLSVLRLLKTPGIMDGA